MGTNRLLFVILAIAILILVLDLMRRSVLREKYAVVWLLTALAFIIFATWPAFVTRLSSGLGFETPSNFVFGLVIVLLLGVVMQLSLEVGKLEDKVQILADESALSNLKIHKADD
jgi:hypothetical protein